MPNNQNPQCPVCQRPVPASALLLKPYLQPLHVTLLQKLNPDWHEGEPVCQPCLDAVLDTIGEAETQEERLNSQGRLSDYYRYVLTKRESIWWHHQNPDMRKWKRGEIEDKVAGLARAAGFGAWVVFDKDETLLSQTVGSG